MFKENFFNNSEETKTPTHYEVLGVSSSATKEEIKTAFRRLALETHSDHPKNKGKEEEWLAVNEAYETLSNAEKKDKYDKENIHNSGNPFEEEKENKADSKKDSFYEEKMDFKNQRNSATDKFIFLTKISKKFDEHLNNLKKDALKNQIKIKELLTWHEKMTSNILKPNFDLKTCEAEFDAMVKQNEEIKPKPWENKKTSQSKHETSNSEKEKLRIIKNGSFYRLVNEQGDSLSDNHDYNRIEEKNGYYIGVDNIGYERILDPHTGKELSLSYKKIDFRGDIIIGIDSMGYERIINSPTEGDISHSYKKITIMEGLVVGEDNNGHMTVLDSSSGKKISSTYQKIYLRNGILFGKNHLKEEEILINNHL